MADKIQITGLREFQAALKAMDRGLPKLLRLALNEASQVVIDYAKPHMPSRSGRSRGSVKARSSQRESRVAIGGARAAWVPWLDFGGEGRRRGRPSARPFIREGRYLYVGLRVKRDEVTRVMSEALTALATDAGLEVT